MECWRISNYRDLSGSGGQRVEGRWHSKGRSVVYLADHASSALLEQLVHLDPEVAPSTYQLLRVEVPDNVSIDEADLSALPQNWRDQPDITRRIGDEWLIRRASCLLRVPSALSPRASNFLLNPACAAASDVRIVEAIVAPFDPRFWKR